jgi:hypothetical protein
MPDAALPLAASSLPTSHPRWEKFTAAVSSQQHKGVAASVGDLFPFKKFFADAPQPLFKGQSYDEVRYSLLHAVSNSNIC